MADSHLPRSVFRALKPFWTTQLSTLKRESFLKHRAWLDHGKPSQGLVHDLFVKSKRRFKVALR